MRAACSSVCAWNCSWLSSGCFDLLPGCLCSPSGLQLALHRLWGATFSQPGWGGWHAHPPWRHRGLLGLSLGIQNCRLKLLWAPAHSYVRTFALFTEASIWKPEMLMHTLLLPHPALMQDPYLLLLQNDFFSKLWAHSEGKVRGISKPPKLKNSP